MVSPSDLTVVLSIACYVDSKLSHARFDAWIAEMPQHFSCEKRLYNTIHKFYVYSLLQKNILIFGKIIKGYCVTYGVFYVLINNPENNGCL